MGKPSEKPDFSKHVTPEMVESARCYLRLMGEYTEKHPKPGTHLHEVFWSAHQRLWTAVTVRFPTRDELWTAAIQEAKRDG